MATNSKIEWCHHTFNAWMGCTKVSAGCANCYAENLMDTRYHKVKWGPQGTRVVKKDWSDPPKWDRAAKAAGERHRVFCASLADVFEGPETMPASEWPKVCEARQRLLAMIAATPDLDWLLLTKRPDGVMARLSEVAADTRRMNHHPGGAMLAERWANGEPPANVWLGASCEDQAAADERIPHLLRCPAKVRFLSLEPLLGPVDLTRIPIGLMGDGVTPCVLNPLRFSFEAITDPSLGRARGLDWVIVGGESGPSARPCNVDWVRGIVRQCKDAGVACFVKQLGSHVIEARDYGAGTGRVREGSRKWRSYEFSGGSESMTLKLRDRKGGDISEFPADLRVRQFPGVTP